MPLETGQLLKQTLDNQGLKYRHVSEAVGVARDLFNRYLNGRAPMPEVKLRCVCLTFGLDLAKFGLRDYRPEYLKRA